MQTIDRTEFFAWTEGTLLQAGKDIPLIVVNELLCEKAMDELEEGNAIVLTEEGTIVSYVVPRDGEYVELTIDEYLEYTGQNK